MNNKIDFLIKQAFNKIDKNRTGMVKKI